MSDGILQPKENAVVPEICLYDVEGISESVGNGNVKHTDSKDDDFHYKIL